MVGLHTNINVKKILTEKTEPIPTSALLAAIAALILWGGTAIANKIAVGYMSGLTAGVLRSMLAGLLALSVASLLRLPFPKTFKDRLLLFVSGISSFALWPIFLSVGIEQTTAGHAALIMAMIPVLTVFITSIIQASLPSAKWWFGATIALVATVILITSRGITLEVFEDGSSILGDITVLAGCGICATGYVAGAKLSKKIGTAATTFWGLSVALIVLVPIFISIFDNTQWSAVSKEGWMGIAWMTFLSSFAGYALWFFALARGGISRIGSMQLMMPVLSLVFAAIVLGESPTQILVFTCITIMIGTFLAQRGAA